MPRRCPRPRPPPLKLREHDVCVLGLGYVGCRPPRCSPPWAAASPASIFAATSSTRSTPGRSTSSSPSSTPSSAPPSRPAPCAPCRSPSLHAPISSVYRHRSPPITARPQPRRVRRAALVPVLRPAPRRPRVHRPARDPARARRADRRPQRPGPRPRHLPRPRPRARAPRRRPARGRRERAHRRRPHRRLHRPLRRVLRDLRPGPVHRCSAEVAELTKLAENAFRDVNIAFANELANVCAHLGLDVWEVIRLANRHPRVQILRPGPGVGGHCIAVDPWFIAASAPA
jgi:hypothetical protein